MLAGHNSVLHAPSFRRNGSGIVRLEFVRHQEDTLRLAQTSNVVSTLDVLGGHAFWLK